MTTYTKIAVKGAAIVLFLSLIAAFLGYLVRVILAKNLSMEEFGLFYAVFGFLGLIELFKAFGVDALVRFIPEFIHKKRNDFIKSSIMYVAIIQFIINSIFILVVYLLADFLSVHYFKNTQSSYILKLMAIAFFVDSFPQILKSAFQGFRKMGLYSMIDLIRMLLIAIIILIGLKLSYGIFSPVIAYIIVPVILIAVFGAVLVKSVFRDFFKSQFVVDKTLLRRISHYSFYYILGGMGIVIMGSIDIVMLTYFSGLASVALYSVALPTTRLLAYFTQAISRVLLPLTSELWSKKKKKILAAGIESLYKYSFIVMVPLAFMMFSFSDLIINIFFGTSYIPAANAMKILSIGMIFTAIGSRVPGSFFAGIEKPQITNRMVYSAAIFNFIGNLIFIPILGIIGAAITTSLSYFIMMVIGLINIRKFIKISFPIKIWAKTILVGLIFTFIIWLLKGILFLNIWLETPIVLIVSGLSYIVMLFLFRIIEIKELKDLYKRILK